MAFRACRHCIEWQYDETTGKVVIHPPRSGQPLRRVGKPPCMTSVGCAKGTPESSVALLPKNLRAYLHYLECRAVGRWPDDPTVKRNAVEIRAIEDARARREQIELAVGKHA